MLVTVLGTGLMGFPMARRLCEHQHAVTVWNRTASKAAPLGAYGARIVADPRAAVQGAQIVVAMLENGPAMEDLLFAQDVAGALSPGSLLIDMASMQPAEARSQAGRLAALGVDHLDAPVSGGTVGAEQGSLAIMAGGDALTVERARAIFECLGNVTHVGPHGAGQLAKLANQMIVGITIGAVAEALLFAARVVADMAKVREAIGGGFAASRVLELHGRRMVDRDFTKRASMTVQLKDMRNAAITATELGFDAPITTLFEKIYAQAVANGDAELDHSGLFVELARRNGMR